MKIHDITIIDNHTNYIFSTFVKPNLLNVHKENDSFGEKILKRFQNNILIQIKIGN